MKKKNKGRYLKKFKSSAINLVVNDGLSVRSAAKQLSMPKSTLAGWVRKLQSENSIEKSALPKEPPNDSTEIKQLKQELAKVKTERDGLKKKAEVIPYSREGHLEPSREDEAIKQLYTDNAESLLDTARMQWQFGDWESLANLDGNKLQHHPDRAKLALLVATGWQQLNDQKKTHKYIKLAKKWGCDKQLIARLLIAGVHNTLGCAATAGRQENRALNHFRSAVKGVSGDARLAYQARSVREITKLGLFQQAAAQISKELKEILPLKSGARQVGLLYPNSFSRNQQSQSINGQLISPSKGKAIGLDFNNKLEDRIKEFPVRIIVAGMRHCGSTALFNIIRLGLIACNVTIHACYSEYEGLAVKLPDKKGLYLLKTHEFRDDIAGWADIVITTRRDLRDTVASAVRRGFALLEKMGIVEYAKYNRMLHDSWLSLSDYEFIYEDFMMKPVETIENLLSSLGLHDVDSDHIYSQLIDLPVDDYKNTLFSPTHITDPERKFSYTDNLDRNSIRKIEAHNSNWLEVYGYKRYPEGD